MSISYQGMTHRIEKQKLLLHLVSIFLIVYQAQGQGSYTICRQETDQLGLYDVCYDVVDFNTITSYYLTHADNVTSRFNIGESNTLVLTNEDFQNPIFDKIEAIYFDYDSIKIFKPEPLTGLKNLNKLVLYSNQISTIYDNSFAGLNLSVIYMDHNEITNIEEGAFRGQVNLVNISMAGNELTQLPAKLFKGLKQLGFLNLDRNGLTSIDDKLFQGLINLKDLKLYGNAILNVGPYTFKTLSNLANLYLGSNQLTAIAKDVFSGNTKLKILDLSNNNLSNLDQVVLNISSLLELGLVRNKITRIPSDFFHLLPNLDGINLSYNKLNTSTDVFDRMPVLREVYVGGGTSSAVPHQGFRNAEWKEGDYPSYNIFVGLGISINCNITDIPRLNSTFDHNISSIEKVITCFD